MAKTDFFEKENDILPAKKCFEREGCVSNDANKKASDERENKMSSLTAGVKMPGVF